MMRLGFFWKWLKAEYKWRVRGKRYEIRFSPEAQTQMDALPQDEQDEIMKIMDKLRKNPYTGDRLDQLEDEEQ